MTNLVLEETFPVKILPPDFPNAYAPIISSVLTFMAISFGFYFKIYRESIGFMVFLVNFSDFIYTFTRIFPYIYNPGGDIMCIALTTIGCYGILSSTICSIFFGNILFLLTTEGGSKKLNTRFKYYIILATTVPIPFALTTLFWDHAFYDEQTEACVHDSIIGKHDWAFAFRITAPITICCILSVIWYSMASFRIKKVLRSKNTRYLLVLVGYPGIVLLCWFPLLICNLLIGCGLDINPGFYQGMQLLPYLQGAWDALTYGCLRNPIRKACLGSVRCWKREQDDSFTVASGGNEVLIDKEAIFRNNLAFTPTSSFTFNSDGSSPQTNLKRTLT